MNRFILPLLVLASIAGCATGDEPSAFERTAYYVTTNWVPQPVQRVQVSSNMIGTNSVLVITNIFWETNLVGIPNLEPRESVTTSLKVGGAVATGLGAPWLLPIFGLLGSLYAGWAEFRNSRKKKLNKTFGQNLETALETFKAIGGDTLRSKFKHEIKAQQVEAGVKSEAEVVADEQVNTVKAEEAATRVNKVVAVPNGP